MRMHSKQMIKPGLAQCITVHKMRGLKPSHMNSMSVCKSQQHKQRQQSSAVCAPSDVAESSPSVRGELKVCFT